MSALGAARGEPVSRSRSLTTPSFDHRRRRTLDHFDVSSFGTAESSSSGRPTQAESDSRLSSSSPTAVTQLELSETLFLSPQRHRVRSRAQQRAGYASAGCSQPPRSPSHKFAQRLASPPTSPLGPRSGLSRILSFHEESDAEHSSQQGRAANLPRDGELQPPFNASTSGGGRRSVTLDSGQQQAAASALALTTGLLSRSTSLRSNRADRYQYEPRRTSRHGGADSSEELPPTASSPTRDKDWSTRARRWSSSMSRRMSISAIESISSTTSPYLKAGLDELRSIFDVDSIGAYDEAVGRYRLSAGDLEECAMGNDIPSSAEDEEVGGSRGEGFAANGLGLYGRPTLVGTLQFPRRLGSDAIFDSPENLSGLSSRDLSRQATVKRSRSLRAGGTGCSSAARQSSNDRDGPSLAVRTSQDSARERSTDRDSVAREAAGPSQDSKSLHSLSAASRRRILLSSKLSSAAATAVGLAAIATSVLTICTIEASIHPDAASMPLVAFMFAQPLFAVTGLIGLLLQRRWLMDLSSRLLRAHVLCQVVIALAALRNLSSSAIYYHHHTTPRTAPAAASSLVGKSLVTNLRFSRFDANEERERAAFAASVGPNPAGSPHQSNVGSLRDQLTYFLVFVAQAALPLLAALWLQYGIAMRLSSLALTASAGKAGGGQSASLSKTEISGEGGLSRRNSRSTRPAQVGAPDTRSPTQQQASKRSDTATFDMAEVKLQPAPLLDFTLDPADLSSRLERVRTESLRTSPVLAAGLVAASAGTTVDTALEDSSESALQSTSTLPVAVV